MVDCRLRPIGGDWWRRYSDGYLEHAATDQVARTGGAVRVTLLYEERCVC